MERAQDTARQKRRVEVALREVGFSRRDAKLASAIAVQILRGSPISSDVTDAALNEPEDDNHGH